MKSIRIWGRYTSKGAFDYLHCEIWQASPYCKLATIDCDFYDLTEIIAEHSITLVSIQSSFHTSDEYRKVENASYPVEVVSVAG